MMASIRGSVAAAVVVALAASCANMELTQTGFLDDYEQLQPDPSRESDSVPNHVCAYEAADADWARYDSVVVEPVVFRPASERSVPEPEVQAELARDFTGILEERLGKDLEVVTTPGPNSVLVRAAITDVDCSNIWINWIGVVLVVPPDMGGIAGELEVRDATSGERLLAMTATREGTPFQFTECFSTWGHAHWGMKKWAAAIAETLRPPAEETEAPGAQ